MNVRARRRRRLRGVTLIELLVAMTLFSLLSAAVLFSLRTGIGSLERVREHTISSRRKIGAQRSLELMLASITRATAQFVQPGNSTPQAAFFFQGDPATMRFVSHYSLQDGARTAPRLVELTVIPALEQGVRLVMNEMPYPGPVAAGTRIAGMFPNPAGGQSLAFHPVSIGPATFVVADRLPSCRFFYLEKPVPERGVWMNHWSGFELPKAIRIVMGDGRAVTAPIYVAPTTF